jgi:hypothetical protein
MATLEPECGGCTVAFNVIPAVAAVAFVNVTPRPLYVEPIGVESARPSKVIIVAAEADPMTAKNATVASKSRAHAKLYF